EVSVAGLATGRGTLRGPASELDTLTLDLTLADAALRSGETQIEGPLTLRLELAKPQAPTRRGTLVADLSEARAAQGETFVKPVGVRLIATTKLSGAESGRTDFESRIALHNINELQVRGSLGEKTAFVLTSPAFDLRGWSDLLPALADAAPEGAMAFERFSFERTEGAPDRFGGRISLRNVDLQLPGVGRVRIRGNADGSGERIDLSGLSATLHGLTLGIDGRVERPLADARFELAAHSIGEAEANDLVSGLSSVRDTVYGALRFDARLSGIGGGEAPMLESLAGNVRFTVGESGGGRLRGVSFLRTTLAQIPLLGGAARIAERLRAQPGMPDALGSDLGERFELLEGDLAIAEGAIDARTLRIRYRAHEARLTGRMQLDGLELDMRGELLLDSPLVAALAGRPASAFAGRAPIRIPLARVTNTLADPKITLSPETLAAAPQLLFLTTGVGQVVDDAIGKVGGAVDRAIGDLGRLGGKSGQGGSGKGDGDGARTDTPPVPVPAPEPLPVPEEVPAPESAPESALDPAPDTVPAAEPPAPAAGEAKAEAPIDAAPEAPPVAPSENASPPPTGAGNDAPAEAPRAPEPAPPELPAEEPADGDAPDEVAPPAAPPAESVTRDAEAAGVVDADGEADGNP
ncbi:MAG: AsmA-like C-terminal region-containing protein, partial [Myxococcota bacterium]